MKKRRNHAFANLNVNYIIGSLILFFVLSGCSEKQIDGSQLEMGNNPFYVDTLYSKLFPKNIFSGYKSDLLVTYKGRNFTGVAYSNYGNNKPDYKIEFKHGRPNGKWQEYYLNGNLDANLNFVNGILIGEQKVYYENGNLVWHSFRDKQGLRQGVYKSYYENGNVKDVIPYKDSEIDGACYTYNEKGGLITKAGYKNNLKNGVYEEYYGDGSPKRELNYLNGVLNGVAKVYDKDGNYAVNHLSKGKPVGEVLFYDINGKLKGKKVYKNGKLIDEYARIKSLINKLTPSELNKLYRFIEKEPCIYNILDDVGISIVMDSKKFIIIKMPRTGNPRYDATGGIGFYDFGVCYKIGEPRAIGNYQCKKESYKKEITDRGKQIKGDGNPHTGLSGISIKWLTDENGHTLRSAPGIAKYTVMFGKPLPHPIGSRSTEISRVQVCLPNIIPRGVLDEQTVRALQNMGYDMSKGLTVKIYNDIMRKCGKPLYKSPAERAKEEAAKPKINSALFYKTLANKGYIVGTDNTLSTMIYKSIAPDLNKAELQALNAQMVGRGYRMIRNGLLPPNAKYAWQKQ